MSDPLPFADPPDGISRIHQNVTGDRNQVIGRMLGGIVINQLTIHDRVPAAAALPPISVAPSLTQQEYRQRQVLLNKVKEYWVKGVLETSLHTRALIELGLQERLDLVQRPFREVAEFPEISATALAEDTSATTVFEQMGAGRTLLILGEPGSGKTITLLKLAEDLISRTEKDLSQPIPVIFNLSSWAKKSQAIKQWLIQELLEKYQVSKALGKQWVETESLILLLDGLDEVKAEQRNTCVQALNQFMQTHGTTELTICCRIIDYQALTEQLMLRTAVCIQPLTPGQINYYFDQAGEQLSALKTVLHHDKDLQGLATSPLMLSIMSLAYRDCATKDMVQGGTITDYQKRLFDTYVERMFQRQSATQYYPRQQTQHWLIWLAQRMTAADQTVFLIEQIQPSWLTTKLKRSFYAVNSVLLGGLIGILVIILVSIPIKLIELKILKSFVPGFFIDYSNFSLINFLIHAGLIEALIVGLLVGISQGEIKTFEILNWSWKNAKSYFPKVLKGFSWLFPGLVGGFIGWHKEPIFGLFLGLLMLIIVNLSRWDMRESQQTNWSWKLFLLEIASVIPVLFGGLIGWWIIADIGFFLGSFLGIIVGLINSGLTYSASTIKDYPNQGIWKSCRNSLSVAILVYVFSFISYELSVAAFYPFSSARQTQGLGLFLFFASAAALRLGMIAALIAGSINGGITCIQHFTLRLMFYCLRYSPWNYARFLNYCTDRLFLQKVGGGYIFVHRMLMEHFAEMPLEQGRR